MTHPASGEPTYLSPAEFRRLGYLQELNRCFLHPLGLALSTDVADDGTETFGAIWDCREDPDGIWFGGQFPADAKERADRIAAELATKMVTRVASLGFIIEPLSEEG